MTIGSTFTASVPNSAARNQASKAKILLCAAVLGICAGVGQSQSVSDTTQDAGSLPTWNDTCNLSLRGPVVRWAVGDSGRVLKMVNGDTTAGYVVGKGQYDLCGVSFADANHGWIVGNKRDEPERGRGVVFSTKRSGNKVSDWVWSCPVVRPDLIVPFVAVQALDARHVWVTCGDAYMLYTNDGGACWAVTGKRLGSREYGSRENSSEK